MNTTILTNRYSVLHNPPTKGARVRIYDIDVHSDYEGHEATVADMSVDATMCYAEVKSIQKPDDSLQVRFASYEIIDPNPDPYADWDIDAYKLAIKSLQDQISSMSADVRPSEETAIITDLQQQVERLARDLDSARTRLRAYDTDADTLGTMLMDEAENRSWCDEYDEFVDNANSRMTTIHLPERQQEYTVTVSGTAVVSWSHDVTVTARSADDAISLVTDCPSDYFDTDEAANDSLNYGYGWDSNDIEDVRVS